MKRVKIIFLVVLCFVVSSVYGQDVKLANVSPVEKPLLLMNLDSLFSKALSEAMPEAIVCHNRGHVLRPGSSMTLRYWEPILVDLEHETFLIYFNPNTISGECMRCGLLTKQPVQSKPDTVIVWEREADFHLVK